MKNQDLKCGDCPFKVWVGGRTECRRFPPTVPDSLNGTPMSRGPKYPRVFEDTPACAEHPRWLK